MENVRIFEKLMEVQHNLSVPKERTNKFGGYQYRSCEDILEALKPILYENKLAITLSDDIVFIGERNYVKATACLIDTETSESVSGTGYAREEETKKGFDGSQITGASSSYARKYALNGLFGIDDAQDSDSTNRHDNSKRHSLVCDECGGEIKGIKCRGELLSPEEQAERWGLCAACVMKKAAGNG